MVRFGQRTATSIDTALLTAILVLVGLLVAFEFWSMRVRLRGVILKDQTLIAYGEGIPIVKIRSARLGGNHVWIELDESTGPRRKLLYKSDFDDFEAALRSFAELGVETQAT